jgi:hypothetical protein
MNESFDPVEQAMLALKVRPRRRAMSEVNLEERIMQEFSKVEGRRRRRWTAVLVGCLALVVSGVGFAAAGGVEAVKNWFVTVEFVDAEGQPKTLEVRDASGQAIGQIQIIGGGPEGPEDGSNNPELNVQLDQR